MADPTDEELLERITRLVDLVGIRSQHISVLLELLDHRVAAAETRVALAAGGEPGISELLDFNALLSQIAHDHDGFINQLLNALDELTP